MHSPVGPPAHRSTHHLPNRCSLPSPAHQTSHNRLQLYALNVSSEALWRLPDSQEVRRVNVYLSHSIHLDYGAVRVADVGGDAKSLLVALSNGTMQVFSWQGKVRVGACEEGGPGSSMQLRQRVAATKPLCCMHACTCLLASRRCRSPASC